MNTTPSSNSNSVSHARTILADHVLLGSLQQLVTEAGEAIMAIYQGADFGIATKQDHSPVTKADLAAHHVLADGLAKLTPQMPIVSEEDEASLSVPSRQTSYWLIDPLDGTKEFINRNGEFTVNLALIEDQRTRLGFVMTPVDGVMYWGGQDLGSWRKHGNVVSPLTVSQPHSPLRVVASKSHLNQPTRELIESLGEVDLVQAGSSLKFVRLAEGKADYYPRLSPTCEWDTAAAQAILEGAGGSVCQPDGQPMLYGKADILNPYFIAKGA